MCNIVSVALCNLYTETLNCNITYIFLSTPNNQLYYLCNLKGFYSLFNLAIKY